MELSSLTKGNLYHLCLALEYIAFLNFVIRNAIAAKRILPQQKTQKQSLALAILVANMNRSNERATTLGNTFPN
ncbi:hypothetical protein NEOLI_000484 [Neolecta irregularis DAH-3]|uniref:Uncharacterized protein n=1 Tax=Neolecta irregularis (strain DAH-3) TaxID=1198029 RepID=A0A1U7LTT6_NEOID|nr:hypothetical protein NEOLI_000484 [Neolecta irregularis DAH-3]|eukprot:OLL26077.1 hypothetical protein NEOLI_000484 [Neolecta irregularis DAH-3]